MKKPKPKVPRCACGRPLTCQCGRPINAGQLLGSMTSAKKSAAARKNAKLGGWPKGKKRKTTE